MSSDYGLLVFSYFYRLTWLLILDESSGETKVQTQVLQAEVESMAKQCFGVFPSCQKSFDSLQLQIFSLEMDTNRESGNLWFMGPDKSQITMNFSSSRTGL